MSTFSCGAAITKVMAVSPEDTNFIFDKIKELEGLGATLEQAQKVAVADAIARLETERQEVLAAVREKLAGMEKAAPVEADSEQETGDFGPILTQFKGDAQGAINALTELQNGEAVAALHHPAVGDIDLVWGKEGTGKSNGFGLAKLRAFHPEILDDLQGAIDGMSVVFRNDTRVRLESATHEAGISLDWFGKQKTWLLTAYEKDGSAASTTMNTADQDKKGDSPSSASTGESVVQPTPEVKAQSESTANDRDHFTLERLNHETNSMEPVTFARGEYVRYSLGEGEIDGISHAKREFSIDGLWYPFGAAYKTESPVEVKSPTVPLSSVIDSINKKHGQGLTDADAVPQDISILDAEKSLWSRITDGTATVNEFKAGFENWVSRKDEIIATLMKNTKDQLLKMRGNVFGDRYRNEPKAELVDAMWRDGANRYVLARSFSHGMGKNAWIDGVRNMVVIDRAESSPNDGAMFSARTSAPEQQLALQQIERLVQSALRGVKNAPTVRVVANPEAIGLRSPVDTVPSGVTLASGDIYVFQSGIGSALDVYMVVFHELFHKGLQNLMTPADYVATMQAIARIDAKVRQYASEWSDSNAGKDQLKELGKKYSGKELADQYEALAIEEGLARVAEDLKAKREMGTKDIRVRRLVSWLADVADKIGMTRLADSLRAMSYSEAEKFVIATIGRAGGRETGAGVRYSAGMTNDDVVGNQGGRSADDINTGTDENTGLPLNADGTVTVYHHTSAANAKAIRQTGMLKAQAEPDVYVTTRQEVDTGYGDTAVPIRINPDQLAIDDEFPDGRKDFRLSTGKPGGSIRVTVENEPSAPDSDGARFRAADTLNAAANNVLANKVVDKLNEHFSHPGKVSWWDKTVGSPYHLAERSHAFKRVFEAVQRFINDVSFYANEAADLAPKLLPKLDTWRDLGKQPISAADNTAIAAPIYEGTLSWTRDEAGKPVLVDDLTAKYADLSDDAKGRMLLRKNAVTEDQLKRWKASKIDVYEGAVRNRFEAAFLKPGVVWTDAELKSLFSLTPEQIGLYKQFRAAIDKSIDNMAKSEMLRAGGKDVAGLRDMAMDAVSADDASILLRDHLLMLATEDPERSDSLTESANAMIDKADKATKLKKEGYAPLSRFGRYSVDVVVDGKREYFGLFETVHDSNKMAAKMKMLHGAANVAQGTMSQKQFQLFQGVTPESLELFGNMLGLESDGDKASDKAFQDYLRLTKNNRSAMKRLIHRKGIAGYSEDVGRTLAAFVYSNARQTAAGLHMGEMGEAVNDIPKVEGELKDAAIELTEYVKNPREEAQALRGLMFAQYLGGSVASAFVNFTQPMTVSFPYLSQFGGAGKAGAALIQAMKDQRSGKMLEPGLARALKIADETGTTQPQAVHELMAQSRGAATLKAGDGTRMGDASALIGNNVSKLALGWGKLFGLAEQINRRSTFIAAYRIAVEQKIADPAGFATKAVNETQFINNKGNKAKFGRGAIGATLMTFKSYSINYLELLHRMATHNGPEGKKAAALMLGMLFLMAGAGGMPGADDLDDVIDLFAQRLGYNFSSQKAKQEFLEGLFGKAGAQFVERGITGLPGAPIDVSGRMSMGNLIPGTGLLLKKSDHTRDVTEVAGAFGDMAIRAFKAGDQLLSGDLGKAILTASPKAASNFAQGVDMASSGMYKDAKGYKVIDTTPTEAAMKAIGFQPASVSKVQEANYLNQRAKDFYSLHAADIRSRWAKGIFEDDKDQVQAARDMMKTWNDNNPDQRIMPNMVAIMRKVHEMRKTKEQRIADTAPKAMRATLRQQIAERAAQ